MTPRKPRSRTALPPQREGWSAAIADLQRAPPEQFLQRAEAHEPSLRGGVAAEFVVRRIATEKGVDQEAGVAAFLGRLKPKPPPSTLPGLRADAIPPELVRRPQWVGWRYRCRDDHWTKVPLDPATGRSASASDPATWTDFAQALQAARDGEWDGVGYVFAPDDPYVGVDLDGCLDEQGVLVPEAAALLRELGGYAETSPSERGVKVWVRAALPIDNTGRKSTRVEGFEAIEMYQHGRFFTVTGRRRGDGPVEIPDRSDAVAAVFRRVFGAAAEASASASERPFPAERADEEILRSVRRAKNRDKFEALWSGDLAGYDDDHSAADLALCSLLAFRTDDPAQIERLFARSKLGQRDKWRERADYRERTIRRALAASPRVQRAPASPRPRGARVDVFLPGVHGLEGGGSLEVGTDEFASQVLAALPADALYRMDDVVGRIVGASASRRFHTVEVHLLRQVVDRHVAPIRQSFDKNRGGTRAYSPCGRDEGQLVLAAARAADGIRQLRLLSHYPVYGPGLELARPGWNEDGGIYYDPPEALRDLVPAADGWREHLEDLFVDFPLQDAASFHNLLGLMLTVILRPAIRGPVPFHLLLAPLPRTGKGKCLNAAVGESILGRGVSPLQLGRTEEEREKRITSVILAGDPVVHFDNVAVGDVLDSAALASLATAYPDWRGRVLGVSKTPSLPNNLVVAFSGNNVQATDEIVKRTIPIVLQPADDHPESRTEFVHPEIEAYARSRRAATIAVLVGMVEHWRSGGMPAPPPDRTVGGFEAWSRTVGGVLLHAGFADWLANYPAWVRSGADPWTADLETLVRVWHERFGEREVSPAQLLEVVRRERVFPDVLACRPQGQAASLAKRVLIRVCDRPVGAWRIARCTSGSNTRYRLVRNSVAGVSGVSGVFQPRRHG